MSLEYVSLGEVADITKLAGFEFTKYIDYLDYGEIVALRALNLRNGSLDLSDVKYISKEVSESLPRSKLYKNDILLTYTGNGYGDCAIVKENDKYHLAPNIAKISPKKINPYFLFEFINSKYFKKQMRNFIGGSSQPTIPMKTLRILEVPFPEEEIQNKIAIILSNINKKITINKEINKNLEQLLYTIFNYWFISFDKFKNVKFKQSPLGDIPDGWDCGALRDLLTLTKNPIKADETNGLPYLPIDIIPMNSLGISELKSDEEANSSLITFNKNDILIGAMRVYFHRVVISPCSGVTRSTCFVLNPKQEHHLSYLLLLCNLDKTIQYAQNTSKGTTMPYAVWDNGLGDMDIIIPSDDILLEFHKLVFPIIEKIRDSYLEINKLSKLRDILLPKLMSGEIDVSKINCDLIIYMNQKIKLKKN